MKRRLEWRKSRYGKRLKNEGKRRKAICLYKTCYSSEQIKKCERAKAIESYKSGDYDEAFLILEEIEGYKDVNELQEQYHKELREKAVNNVGEKLVDEINSIEVGDVFKFGKYVTNKESGQKEPIEWIVNSKVGGGYEVLLTSRDILTYRHFYDSKTTEATWDKSSLRKWLNKDFLNNSFSKNEQKLMVTSDVPAEKSYLSYGSTLSGNDTKDKVYILSIDEALNYYPNLDGRFGMIMSNEETDYAKSVLKDLGDKPNDSVVTAGDYDYEQEYSVWLRNPGEYEQHVAYYYTIFRVDGKKPIYIDQYGKDAYTGICGVRPTIRINLLQQ